ncbi:MAG: type II secretion system F family protein [Planctomycetota bacterium]
MTKVQAMSIKVAAPAPSASVRTEGEPPLATPSITAEGNMRLTRGERFALLDQLATLLDSGIQIPAALQSMRAQTAQERPAAVLAKLEHAVVGGRPLSEAMALLPRAFPKLLTQMVRAGEVSSSLAPMLRRTVEMLDADAQLRSRLRSATLYPLIMLLLTGAVVVFMLGVIVPRFERLFAAKQAILPAPTRALMAVGNAVTSYWPWALLALVVSVVAAVAFARTADGRRTLDAALLRLPLFGPLYRQSVLARSARTLGLLVQAGVPVHAALDHAREVAGSATYAEFWRRAQQEVLNGSSLTDAVRGRGLVPPTFEQILAAGEATANLDGVLLKAAEQYYRELSRRARDVLTVVEPAMVVLMGGVVGFIALAIMLPIFRLART